MVYFYKICGTIAVMVLLVAFDAEGGRSHPEKYYQKIWCAEHGGKVEYVLPDRSRVDCLTASVALEVDFADKWAEGIGQALMYANTTNRPPGVALIMEQPYRDFKYLKRLLTAVQNIDGFQVWVIWE